MNGPNRDTIARKNVERYSDGESWSEKDVLNHYNQWLWSLIRSATINIPWGVWAHLKATKSDLHQEARIALLLRWRTYQKEKINFPFIPYAYKRVRGAIVDGFREGRSSHSEVEQLPICILSFDEILRVSHYRETLSHSYEPTYNDEIDLVAALGTLEKWEKNFINLLYVKGETLKYIGNLAGVTESRACQIHTKIIGKLRKHMQVA